MTEQRERYGAGTGTGWDDILWAQGSEDTAEPELSAEDWDLMAESMRLAAAIFSTTIQQEQWLRRAAYCEAQARRLRESSRG